MIILISQFSFYGRLLVEINVKFADFFLKAINPFAVHVLQPCNFLGLVLQLSLESLAYLFFNSLYILERWNLISFLIFSLLAQFLLKSFYFLVFCPLSIAKFLLHIDFVIISLLQLGCELVYLLFQIIVGFGEWLQLVCVFMIGNLNMLLHLNKPLFILFKKTLLISRFTLKERVRPF